MVRGQGAGITLDMPTFLYDKCTYHASYDNKALSTKTDTTAKHIEGGTTEHAHSSWHHGKQWNRVPTRDGPTLVYPNQAFNRSTLYYQNLHHDDVCSWPLQNAHVHFSYIMRKPTVNNQQQIPALSCCEEFTSHRFPDIFKAGANAPA